MHKQKTVTVSDHEKFRRSIINPAPPPIPPFDEIDELVADPCLDHPPALRSRADIDRLLAILDTIGVESGEG